MSDGNQLRQFKVDEVTVQPATWNPLKLTLVPTTSPTYNFAASLVVNVDQPAKVVSARFTVAPSTKESKFVAVALYVVESYVVVLLTVVIDAAAHQPPLGDAVALSSMHIKLAAHVFTLLSCPLIKVSHVPIILIALDEKLVILFPFRALPDAQEFHAVQVAVSS